MFHIKKDDLKGPYLTDIFIWFIFLAAINIISTIGKMTSIYIASLKVTV